MYARRSEGSCQRDGETTISPSFEHTEVPWAPYQIRKVASLRIRQEYRERFPRNRIQGYAPVIWYSSE